MESPTHGVVTLDVRPFHERGEEPFNAIMDAVLGLEDEQQLLLINSFNPTPLIRVLDRRGFEALVTAVESGEWHILFSRR